MILITDNKLYAGNEMASGQRADKSSFEQGFSEHENTVSDVCLL